MSKRQTFCLKKPGMYHLVCNLRYGGNDRGELKLLVHDIVQNGMSTKLVSKKTWEGKSIHTVTKDETGYEEFRGLKMRALQGSKMGMAVCVGPVEGKLWRRLDQEGTWDIVTSTVDAIGSSMGVLVWVTVVVHINGTRDIINWDIWSYDEIASSDDDTDDDKLAEEKNAKWPMENNDENCGNTRGKKQASIKSYFTAK